MLSTSRAGAGTSLDKTGRDSADAAEEKWIEFVVMEVSEEGGFVDEVVLWDWIEIIEVGIDVGFKEYFGSWQVEVQIRIWFGCWPALLELSVLTSDQLSDVRDVFGAGGKVI